MWLRKDCTSFHCAVNMAYIGRPKCQATQWMSLGRHWQKVPDKHLANPFHIINIYKWIATVLSVLNNVKANRVRTSKHEEYRANLVRWFSGSFAESKWLKQSQHLIIPWQTCLPSSNWAADTNENAYVRRFNPHLSRCLSIGSRCLSWGT